MYRFLINSISNAYQDFYNYSLKKLNEYAINIFPKNNQLDIGKFEREFFDSFYIKKDFNPKEMKDSWVKYRLALDARAVNEDVSFIKYDFIRLFENWTTDVFLKSYQNQEDERYASISFELFKLWSEDDFLSNAIKFKGDIVPSFVKYVDEKIFFEGVNLFQKLYSHDEFVDLIKDNSFLRPNHLLPYLKNIVGDDKLFEDIINTLFKDRYDKSYILQNYFELISVENLKMAYSESIDLWKHCLKDGLINKAVVKAELCSDKVIKEALESYLEKKVRGESYPYDNSYSFPEVVEAINLAGNFLSKEAVIKTLYIAIKREHKKEKDILYEFIKPSLTTQDYVDFLMFMMQRKYSAFEFTFIDEVIKEIPDNLLPRVVDDLAHINPKFFMVAFFKNGANDALVQKLFSFIKDEKLLEEMYKLFVIKGNFHIASSFLDFINHQEFADNVDNLDVFVDSLKVNLAGSVEPNKYLALTHLIDKAGIKIPFEQQGKLKEFKSNVNKDEFKFIDGVAHKLAAYYLSRNEKLHDALAELDNDFALEVLTIKEIIPEPLEEDTTVFRGVGFPINEDVANAMFEYGHRALTFGEFQSMLGYYVVMNKDANFDNKRYIKKDMADKMKPNIKRHYINEDSSDLFDFGATYVSLSSKTASDYSRGGSIFEIKLPKGSPKICGNWINQQELVPSYIKGAEIIAIYKLNDKQIVEDVFENPLRKGAQHRFNIGDKVSKEYAGDVERFNNMCKPHREPYHYEYAYDHEIYKGRWSSSQYSKEAFAADQKRLWENYFSGREVFEDDFFAKECNPELYCC